MTKNKVIISILIVIVLITGLSVFLINKNKKIYISNINDIDNVKISMLKLEDGVTTVIKSVPTTGSWIMTYNCDNENVKIFWDEGNRRLFMKNIKPSSCTIRFEESLSAVNVVSMYVDDIYVGELDENKSYDLERYECANNETVTWDTLTNKMTIVPIKKNTNCKLYFQISKYVNAPVLVAGMTPVKWNASNVESTTTANDPEWYDYSAKKWANAKTADGSYWVWIPRYAYKITSGYHTNIAGTIDIKFLIGKTNKTADGTTIETSGYNADTKNTSMYYFLHPAFTFGSDELTGIWVAKYEASVANTNDACYTSESTANCNKTTLVPAFKPNVKSWRYLQIGNMYEISYNLKSKSNYGWQSSSIDTHQMKNTEWGAVAYLAQTVYGANQEVWINNSGQYITGCAGNSVSEATYAGCQNTYNTAGGIKASTTHNITGIYDMSGGSYEYTASYVNNGVSQLTTYGNQLVSALGKYKNEYAKATTDDYAANYAANKNSYGDAIWETSNSSTGNMAWNLDYSQMIYTNVPFAIRGGIHNSLTNAGVFYFHAYPGDANNYSTFRVVAVIP